MQINIHRMLKRAADCQRLAAPEDALSRIVRAVPAGAELDERTLDHVAAAAKPQGSLRSSHVDKEEK